MDRNFQYDPAPVAATSRSPITVATLSPSWTAGERYLVLATVAVNDTTSTFQVYINCDEAVFAPGGSIAYQYDIATKDPTNDYYSCPMFFGFEVDVGTIIELIVDSAASAPDPGATTRQGHLSVVRLTELDLFSDFLNTGSSTTSTSFTTVTGSTVTITETGEYLVLASASVQKSELTANFNVRLAVNGTTGYGDQTMRANSTTKNFPWATMVKLSLTAGDVLTVEHKVTTTGQVTTSYPSIVALRTNMVPAVHYSETRTDVSAAIGTAGTWVDALSATFRTQNQPALILSTNQYRRGGANVDASAQSLYDGTTIQESRNETVAANGEAVHFSMQGLTPTEALHALKQQIKNEGTGITAATQSESAIAVLTLQDNATLHIKGGQYGGGQWI